MGERKVRPIYEALDARNYKLALKLCTSVLQKPGSHHSLVKALKGVTLQRMGKMDEALATCREIAKQTPPETGETVLSTMMIVFKAAGHVHEGAACYEAAFQADPTNIELANSLFFLHLRAEDWARAQQLAMRMYKQFGDKYLFWVVFCLVVQSDLDCPPIDPISRAVTSSLGLPPPVRVEHAPQKTLQLAVAMLGKARPKLSTEGELFLHLATLKRSGNAEAALELLLEKQQLIGAEVRNRRETVAKPSTRAHSPLRARHLSMCRALRPFSPRLLTPFCESRACDRRLSGCEWRQ